MGCAAARYRHVLGPAVAIPVALSEPPDRIGRPPGSADSSDHVLALPSARRPSSHRCFKPALRAIKPSQVNGTRTVGSTRPSEAHRHGDAASTGSAATGTRSPIRSGAQPRPGSPSGGTPSAKMTWSRPGCPLGGRSWRRVSSQPARRSPPTRSTRARDRGRCGGHRKPHRQPRRARRSPSSRRATDGSSPGTPRRTKAGRPCGRRGARGEPGADHDHHRYADSRVPPEIVFDQGLGDLFVIRVAGNTVAPS